MIDGNTGILDPKGMAGFTLEIGTFLSYALVTHLNNLNNVLSACNCPEYALLPSSVALGETLLTEGEKRSGALLLDLGRSPFPPCYTTKEFYWTAWNCPIV